MAQQDPKLILETIEKNVGRKNRFSFLLTLPQVSGVTVDQTTLEYYCKAINLPSQSITPVDVKYLGLYRYAITSMDVDTVMVTFYDTKQLVLRSMFTKWQQETTAHNKGEVLKYFPNQYQTTARIMAEEKETTIEGIFPITVGDWQMDMESDNQLGTFEVTFKVKSIK